jgi:carbon storage regulator
VLILSRRLNESIVIGDEVVVTVLEVRGDQVRLGIRAPRHVTVHREEVQREIMEQNRQAAAAASRVSSGGPKLPTPPAASTD